MGDEKLLKRKKLSYAEKIQVIELRKTNNTTIRNLADQFKCSTGQIQTILAQREHF
jgi:transposase-like protein